MPGGHVRFDTEDGPLRLPAEPTVGALRTLLAEVDLADDTHLALVQPDLDDVFLALTEAAR